MINNMDNGTCTNNDPIASEEDIVNRIRKLYMEMLSDQFERKAYMEIEIDEIKKVLLETGKKEKFYQQFNKRKWQ